MAIEPTSRPVCTACGVTTSVVPPDATDASRCPYCGGPLISERRSGMDRRGRLQRLWDPEIRSGVERRRPATEPQPGI